MKTFLTNLVAAVALLAAGSAGAILHISNPDYVVIITHEFETSGGTGFGGGFNDSGGGVNLTDNQAFANTSTAPQVTSCTTGSDGVCRLPGQLIIGNRWPGEIIYASDIVMGTQAGSFSSLSRSSDSGIWQPLPPDTLPADPQKCVADICDPARKAQEDNNVIAYAQTKGMWTVGKWGSAAVVGTIASFSPLKFFGGAIMGGGAYLLTKELGGDMLDALDYSQKSAVVVAYNACKKKCGA
jgi:hypothetical protein